MLYKYLPYDRVDVLENLKIRFSPLISLNDPFECQPLVDMTNESNLFLQNMCKDLDALWEQTNTKEKTEENRRIFEKTRTDLIDDVEKKMNSYIVGQELMAHLSDNFGVLSLSRTEESLLMWSHYTNEGQGLVIGFDDEHEFFKQPDTNGKSTRPIPVVYTEKRCKIIRGEDRYYEKLLCEKPRDWAYEEEERLFRAFFTKDGCIGKDMYGMDIILTEIPKEAIKSVYFGYKISEETKNRAITAIRSNLIECKIYQARISFDKYKIEFDEQAIT